MDTAGNRLEKRFILNMQRVHSLVSLMQFGVGRPEHQALEGDNTRGDLGRAIVVFLHATFEDAVRTTARRYLRTRKLKKSTFGTCGDVEKVLTQMGLDAAPFKSLYPALGQMMKRRHQIVHEADLRDTQDSVCPSWTIADDFLLALWSLAVPTFHAQLSVSVEPANEVQRWVLTQRLNAMARTREAGVQLIALARTPKESLALGFEGVLAKLNEVREQLKPASQEEVLQIAKRMGLANIAVGV